MAKIDRERRKRRRIRQLIYVLMFVLFVTGFAWFLEMRSTTTVMVVRHAEVEQGVENPGLSPAGRLRAKELARLLGDVDVTDAPPTLLLPSQVCRVSVVAGSVVPGQAAGFAPPALSD